VKNLGKSSGSNPRMTLVPKYCVRFSTPSLTVSTNAYVVAIKCGLYQSLSDRTHEKYLVLFHNMYPLKLITVSVHGVCSFLISQYHALHYVHIHGANDSMQSATFHIFYDIELNNIVTKAILVHTELLHALGNRMLHPR